MSPSDPSPSSSQRRASSDIPIITDPPPLGTIPSSTSPNAEQNTSPQTKKHRANDTITAEIHDDDDDDDNNNNNNNGKWYHHQFLLDGPNRLVLWQSLILISQMTVGYDEVVAGTFQAMEPWKSTMGHPSPEMLGLITSILFVGGFFGSIFTAFPRSEKWMGRRATVRLGSLICVLGSVIQSVAPGRKVFIVGRVLLGFGISLTTCAGPILLNELAEPGVRGRIGSMFNVLWYVGSIFASWLCFGTGHLQSNWSWRIPSIVQAVFPLIVAISVSFMPESPRWLVAMGRHEEAEAILIKYRLRRRRPGVTRGHDDDSSGRGGDNDAASLSIQREMNEMMEAIAQERSAHADSWGKTLESRANRRRFAICISVAVMTLWNGQGVITYYFSPLLTSIGISGTNQQTGINGGMAVWNLLCSVTGALLTDRIGRRPLWLTSFVGMACANVPLVISGALYARRGRHQSAGYSAVVFLFLYNAAFNVGCNPLPYLYTPEILPYSLRTRGLSLQILVSQICLLVNQYVNPIALDSIGFWYFVFYLGVLLASIATIYFLFPETKGMSVEQLSSLFDDEDMNPSSSTVVVVGQSVDDAVPEDGGIGQKHDDDGGLGSKKCGGSLKR